MMIKSILNWFKVCVPEPAEKNRNAQLACHIEEFTELLEALTPKGAVAGNILEKTIGDLIALRSIAYTGGLSFISHANKIAGIDAICDQIVTGVGLAHFYGFNIEGALTEVCRSNNSKFTDGKPVFNAQGKITKPVSYSPPVLDPFI